MRPRLRWQVGRSAADRLDARLLVVGDDRKVRLGSVAFTQDRDLAIDAQHFCHLLLEGLVAALAIIADLVRLHFVSVEDLADCALSKARQAGRACRLSVLPDVARQQRRRPKLMRIPHLLGLLAGQRHHPCAGVVGNRRLLARPRTVVERRHHAKPHRTIKAPVHGLMGHADRLTDCVGRRIGVIGQQNAGPLDPTGPFCSRPGNRFQFDQVSRCDRDFDYPPRCCHRVQPYACGPYTLQHVGPTGEASTIGRFHGSDVLGDARG